MLLWLTSVDKHDAVIGGTITSVKGIYRFSIETDTSIPATACAGIDNGQRG
jgi:hypothetical protein